MSQITGISSISNISLLFTGTDVNPDALDWTDISVGGSINGQTNTQTFTGINTSINIFFNVTNYTNLGATSFFYSKNGGALISINENTNISISNNDTITWYVQNGTVDNSTVTGLIRVKNASNANTELDRFSYNINPISGGGEA